MLHFDENDKIDQLDHLLIMPRIKVIRHFCPDFMKIWTCQKKEEKKRYLYIFFNLAPD